MKCILPLFIAIAVGSAGVIENPIMGYKEGDRFFYLTSDGDGSLHLVDSQEPVDEEFIRTYGRNGADNQYWLFTRSNPNVAQYLILGNELSVIDSNFDSKKETVFSTHGWTGHGGSVYNQAMTQAFLDDKDVNVIVIDWHEMANKSYTTSKRGVPEVARGIGRFISWLTNFGVAYENVHLVGYSLGGQLVGNAGRETNGRVGRITALDPAGPLWTNDPNRLVSTDGRYVEVIHTNAGVFGFPDPCGDADFYPNGGSIMPGCSLLNPACSHDKAYEYMASTVRYNHLLANQCQTLQDATRDTCNGPVNPMGNSDLNKSRSGIFRVNTGRNYPF